MNKYKSVTFQLLFHIYFMLSILILLNKYSIGKAFHYQSKIFLNKYSSTRIIQLAMINSHNNNLNVPKAKIINKEVYFGKNLLDEDEYRGDTPMDPPIIRMDPYAWLRDNDRKDPEVLEYLQHENQYCEDQLIHLRDLREDLYEEMLSHLKETDEDVPYQHGS